MAIVAGVATHIHKAEDLMAQAHDLRAGLEANTQNGDFYQMQLDIDTMGAFASLASAHIQMAHFLQMRNDS